MALSDYTHFLKQFINQPTSIGAIAPSSSRLAKRMIEWVEWDSHSVVVEFGAGSGAITSHILDRISHRHNFFAIEINPDFVKGLKDKFPNLKIHEDSVENVAALCAKEQVDSVDAVISGLPWAAFPGEMQDKFLDAMISVLKPGGQFTTFAYLQGLALPAGQRFKSRLKNHFSVVEKSKVTWRNLPPAFTYQCIK